MTDLPSPAPKTTSTRIRTSCGRRSSAVLAAAAAVAVLLIWFSVGSASAETGPTPDVTPGSPSFSSPGAQASGSSPLPGVKAVSGAVAEIANVAGGLGTGLDESLAATVIGAALQQVTGSLVDGITGVIDELSAFIDTTTDPQPTDPLFLGPNGPYHTVASFSAALLIGFICLGVAYAVLSGEAVQGLLRLVRDIPLAVLAIIGFPWLVGQLVDLSNGLSAAILPTGQTIKDLLTVQILETLRGIGGGGNAIPAILIGLLTFATTLLVYLELLVRVVLLRLIEALAPLSFAPMVWAPARAAARKVGELTVAVILSQPAVFLALRVGLDFLKQHATSSPGDSGAWGKLMLGLAVLVVAAFSPWVIWRLLPQAEGMMLAQGLSRSPIRGAMSGMQTAYWVTALRSMAGRRSTSGNAATTPGPGVGVGPPRGFPRPGQGHPGGGSPRPGPSPTSGSGPGSGSDGSLGGAASAGMATATTAAAASTPRSADRHSGPRSPTFGTPTGTSSVGPPSPSSRAVPRGEPGQRGPSDPTRPPVPPSSRGPSGSSGGNAAPGWSRRRPPT